jgi:two-component system, response regulator YesN
LFAITYLVMLLLPLLLGVLIYFTSVNVIEDEISQSNVTMLNQMRQDIDRRLLDVREMAIKIGMDTRVVSLAYRTQPMDTAQRYTMYQVVQDFRAYLVPDRYIDRFFVYLFNHDIALTSKGTYNAQSLHALWYAGGKESFDDWYKCIKGVKAPRFLIPGGVSEAAMVYMQPFYISPSGTSVGTIAFFIYPTAIRESISANQTLVQGTVMLTGQDDRVLFSSHPDIPHDTIRFNELSGIRGAKQIMVNGESALVSYIRSEVTDWKYVYVLPMSVYRTKINYIQNMSLVLLAFILVIGGLLIAYFVHINYNPIVKIVSLLKKNPDGQNGHLHNEYTLIQDIVSDLVRDHDRMSSEIVKKDERLRQFIIARLMQEGAVDEGAFREANEQYGFGFTQDRFAVLLFEIEEYGGLLNKDKEIYYIIQSVFKDLAPDTAAAFTEADSYLACLVNLSCQEGEKGKLLRVVEQVLAFVEQKFDILITAAFSTVRHGVANVPEAYQEAMDAMEHKDISGAGGIVDYDAILAKPEPEQSFELFFQDETRLDNLLVNQDFEKARIVLSEVFDNLARMKAAPPKDVLRFRMLGLMNTLLRALFSVRPLQTKRIVGSCNPVKRLAECQRPEEYRQCFELVLSEAETRILDSDRKTPLWDDLTLYVREHYGDPNLSLTMMADVFDMTESGLSRYFRKKIGIGLLEYIHLTRVHEAKELLVKSNKSIKVIAGLVGLDSSDSFIRIFKKYEGVTPGSYREILHKDGPDKNSR